MPTVHGANASPFVRKVRVALAEKGVDYTLNPVMPFGVSDEYLAISPLGKIPTYETDDGRYVNDSSVILQYIERTNPTPALYPSDPYDCARAMWFEEFGDSALTEAVGGVFFQKVVAPTFLGQATDEAAVTESLEVKCPKAFGYLEEQIRSPEQPIVGDTFSVGDIGLSSCFVNFGHAGETVDASRWPKLAAYVEDKHARPSFAGFIAEEKAMFGGG